MIRKIQSIHLYWFHACLNKLTWCLVQNKLKHFKWPYMSLEIESLVQNGSNPSGLSCISPIHTSCHVSCRHHIFALCLMLIVFRCVLRGRFCLRGYSRVSNWRAVSHYHSIRQATHWSFRYKPMFSLLLLFTALRLCDSNCCVLW